jgi:hypothetical protein
MITGSTKDNNSKKVDEVKEIKIHLEFFAVRSKTGQYFRAVGFGGGGKHWVDEIGDAKIYAKIGGARGRVTWFAKNYPQYGIPDIIKITATKVEIVNEVERVKKSILKKEEKELKRKKNLAEWNLKQAEEEYKRAGDKLKKLKDAEF